MQVEASLKIFCSCGIDNLQSPIYHVTIISKFSSDLDSTTDSESPCSSDACSQIRKYVIPWEKFPPALIQACKAQQRPSPSLLNEVIRIISGDIENIKTEGKKSSFLESVANSLFERYPKSFGDAQGGNTYIALKRKILNRLEYQKKGG